MTVGYSLALAEAVQKGDASRSGVMLGRLCIARNIPVAKVASDLGVSRQTVYHWFNGRVVPSEAAALAISEYMEGLRLPPTPSPTSTP